MPHMIGCLRRFAAGARPLQACRSRVASARAIARAPRSAEALYRVRCQSAGSATSPATEAAAALGPWERATQMLENGDVFEGVVHSVNKGGVLVDCWGVKGFMPRSFFATKSGPAVGQTVKAMFVRVDESEQNMFLSEKKVLQAAAVRTLEVGQVVEGMVKWIADYGAFVEVTLPDGKSTVGLVHKSELSWGIVSTPEAAVSVGQAVRCKVTAVDPSRARLTLSMRDLMPDPLKQNLETMVDAQVVWEEATTPLPGLENVVRELAVEEGISQVKIGRQAAVKGGVSQDLELWLTKEEVDGHFNVVARAGSTIQEVLVYCTLDKTNLKRAIDSVLKRV